MVCPLYYYIQKTQNEQRARFDSFPLERVKDTIFASALKLFFFPITAKLQDSGWWIGGRKIQGEFRWQGAPGVWSAMSFTHWYQGQPDNFQGAEECVEIERKGLTPYGWNDNVCSMKLPFICEATSNNHAGLMS